MVESGTVPLDDTGAGRTHAMHMQSKHMIGHKNQCSMIPGNKITGTIGDLFNLHFDLLDNSVA